MGEMEIINFFSENLNGTDNLEDLVLNERIILICIGVLNRSWDGVVGIATGYGLDDRGVGVRVPVGSRIFSSPRRPEVHPNSYPMGTGGYFYGGKAAGA
jgi:hypothetical protein